MHVGPYDSARVMTYPTCVGRGELSLQGAVRTWQGLDWPSLEAEDGSVDEVAAAALRTYSR